MNYYGLIKDRQIMFCLHKVITKKDIVIFPFYKKNVETKYEMSEKGKTFFEKECPKFVETHYIIDIVGKLSVENNDLSMWQELYDNDLFPFWDPRGGPYTMNNKRKGYIVICETYDLPLFYKKGDVQKHDRVWGSLNTTSDFHEALKKKKPLYNSKEFIKRCKEIMRIYFKYKPKR